MFRLQKRNSREYAIIKGSEFRTIILLALDRTKHLKSG
jgi:hypothetical protein